MKSKIIALALLAGLSAPSFAGDFEKVLGGVIIGTVIGSHIAQERSPYYYPPQVVYAPPPQVVYAPPPPVVYAPPPVVYSQPLVVYEQRPVYYGGYRTRYEGRYERRYEGRYDNHRHHDRRW